MKKIVIGSIVAGFIYFALQSIMWMGGFRNDFSQYTSNSKVILDVLNQNLTGDELYIIPRSNPNIPTKEKEKEELMTAKLGKPWAMIFYHQQMDGMSVSYLPHGLPPLFGLFQGIKDYMNWFSFLWHYIKTEMIDQLLGWALSSLFWFAWYFNKSNKLIL
ncbi:MAG: hypothetical protein IPG87_09175 [Saprospiraceae bacterium]|nr:hypothetical protein [Candidatus Vicinibacter affinis]